MSVYNTNGNVASGVYDVNGNYIGTSGGDNAVGWQTAPTYKEVNGDNYRLVWKDEFDGKDINKTYWTDVQLISNVINRYQAWTDYYLTDSKIHLRIKKDAPDRFLQDPNNDVAQSIIQSGAVNGLHSLGTYHDINPFWGLITQEGYYECRMKVFKATGGCHTSWWGVGIQDGLLADTALAEFDFTEILGSNTRQLPHGLHQNQDTSVTEVYHRTDIDVDMATAFHVVGFLWENGVLKWYVDGELIDSIENINTPQYPFMHFLAAYRRLSGTGWTGAADLTLDTVSFDVDYLRIYKKATSVATDDVTLSSFSPITIDATNEDMTIDNERGCPICFKSYVYANWSDGTRTEHWIKWDAVNDTYTDNMTNQTSFQWGGYVYDLGQFVSANITY